MVIDLRKRLTPPRSTLLYLTGLVLTVFAVFAPSLQSGFVYDSQAEILHWDFLHDPGNILTPLTFRIMALDVVDFNRPVSVTSLMFDALLWGKNPLGYHLTNIVLHALITCMVFGLIRHILSRTDSAEAPGTHDLAAFLGALLFAIHPLVTEAVCEPSYRKDLLAACFGLAALLVAARHDPKTNHGDAARLLLCPLLCLLAIGSKEVGVAFPVILFLYWLLFRRREPARFWAVSLPACAIVVAIFLTARFLLEHRPSVVFVTKPVYPGGSFWATLPILPTICTLYLTNIVWPANLCADYNAYSVRDFSLPLSLVLLTIVAALLGWWSARDRRAIFATGLIVTALLPVSNLVPIYHAAADRYMYLPLAGIALLVAIGLDNNWVKLNPVRLWSGVILVLLIATLLIPATLEREKVWSSEVNLWEDTFARNPRSFIASVALPEALYDAGRYQEARTQAEIALAGSGSTFPWAWVNYALVLDRLGDHAGAARAARRAIELKPDVLDTEKMVATLQCGPKRAEAFARLAASLPPAKR